MAWLMASHIVFLVVWAAGLVYIPVLCSSDYRAGHAVVARQLNVHIRFLFVAIVSPAAVLTILTGGTLVYATEASGGWLAAKLTAVAMMAAFHGLCGHMLNRLGHEGLRHKRIQASSIWSLTVPLVLIPVIMWLVLAKPAFMD